MKTLSAIYKLKEVILKLKERLDDFKKRNPEAKTKEQAELIITLEEVYESFSITKSNCEWWADKYYLTMEDKQKIYDELSKEKKENEKLTKTLNELK